jgi:hypothetical protein
MIIVAGGDSFIYGAELADQVNGPSRSTYPALLAKDAGFEYSCAAKSGSANNAISRLVINECQNRFNRDMFVIVQWTFACRYEFRFNYEISKSNWYSINPWDNYDDMNEITQIVHGDSGVLQNHINHFNFSKSTGLGDFSKMFYKHVGDSDIYDTYSTIKEVVFLQQYLKIKNIPYLFTFAENHIHPDNEKFQETRFQGIDMWALRSQIDWSNTYMFPPGVGFNQIERPRGFYQWAIENKYPVGTTHPLEEAHVDAAKLMKDKFNELVKKSV